MIVLRHLLEVGVLNNLQVPEAHGQRRKDDDRRNLQDRQTDADATTIFPNGHLSGPYQLNL
jgi:hypothetical protein